MQVKEKFLKIAAKESLKSGCLRAKRGAVFVRNDKILVEAYNTPYPKNDFCSKFGCLRDKLKLGLGKELEKCRAIHAEAKAIGQAAQKGISLKGAVACLTGMPCINCAKLMLSAGIKEVYYLDLYGDRAGESFLKNMGVKCERVILKNDDSGKRLRDIKNQF